MKMQDMINDLMNRGLTPYPMPHHVPHSPSNLIHVPTKTSYSIDLRDKAEIEASKAKAKKTKPTKAKAKNAKLG